MVKILEDNDKIVPVVRQVVRELFLHIRRTYPNRVIRLISSDIVGYIIEHWDRLEEEHDMSIPLRARSTISLGRILCTRTVDCGLVAYSRVGNRTQFAVWPEPKVDKEENKDTNKAQGQPEAA